MRKIVLLLACCLLLGAHGAECAPLSGSAEWRYGQYRAEEAGETVLDGSFFSQQYSLLYQKKGRFLEGRGGSYDLAIGAEWVGLDNEINGESGDIETKKLFYRGELLLAPGGLPFRLKLYSHDMHRTSLESDYLLARSSADTGLSEGPVLTPGLLNNIQNGQHIQSGATLLIGIRNGSYMGNYRDILSQFPRLLVDYQENYVRDLTNRTPQHYRDRNLAFVSLNKKDNWFHYRLRDYQDFENPAQDYTEKIYMLGTVDHTLTRQWINLTNWIRISADGSYTVTDRVSDVATRGVATPGTTPDTAAAGLEPVESFAINLFGTARRTNWNAASFTNLERTVDQNELTKEFEVPFFASGEFDRNTSWRFAFLGTRDHLDYLDRDAREDKDNVSVSSRLETFRQSRFIMAPHLDAESKQGDKGEGNNVRAGVEYFSNRAFNPRFDLFGAYTVASFSGTAEDGNDVSYWEQEFQGRVETQLNARLRTGIEEKILYGNGELDHTVAERVVPRGSDGLLLASESTGNRRSGSLLRSTTTWFGEHLTASRLTNRLELIYDVITQRESTEDQFILKHSLRYDRRNLQVNMRNELIIGDNQRAVSLSSPSIGVGASAPVPDTSFSHFSTVRYSPGRSWESSASLDYLRLSGREADASQLRIGQEGQYNFFTINGIVRKLAEIREELEFERNDATGAETKTGTFLTLLANYFPTKRMLLGAKVRYRLFSPEDTDELATFLTAGLNFEKLVVSCEYSYGTRSAGELTAERQEHRWEVRVKKIF